MSLSALSVLVTGENTEWACTVEHVCDPAQEGQHQMVTRLENP